MNFVQRLKNLWKRSNSSTNVPVSSEKIDLKKMYSLYDQIAEKTYPQPVKAEIIYYKKRDPVQDIVQGETAI